MSKNLRNEDEGARRALDCINAAYNHGYLPPAEDELPEQDAAEEPSALDCIHAAFNDGYLPPVSRKPQPQEDAEESQNPLDYIQRYYDRRRD